VACYARGGQLARNGTDALYAAAVRNRR